MAQSDHKPAVIDVIVKENPAQRIRSVSSESDEDYFLDATAESRKCSLALNKQKCVDQQDHSQMRNKFQLSGSDEIVVEHVESLANQPLRGAYIEDEVGEEGEEEYIFCFPAFDAAREQANIFAKKVWMASWKVTHFYSLPEWLQDNDFLHTGHRPPLPSFAACFKSIFRVHTETGNIWTHMIGCAAFIGIAAYFLTRPHDDVQWIDKVVFLPFFVGAVACLGLSFAFHTLHCHSERVGKIFSKLDYVGIAMLIMGSFVPWVYYGFYCHLEPKIGYITAVCILGLGCIVVSLWDKFSQPQFRPLRAGLFMGLGLSAVIPCGHYFVVKGIWSAFYEASMGWLLLMAALYISGALFYAFRIPERFFPGKCDILFQSHQIFHLLVVAAAFVHYHGVTEMAVQRLQGGSCEEEADGNLLLDLVAGRLIPELDTSQQRTIEL